MTGHIITSKINSAYCIQLNRSEKKNALTAEMYTAIAEGIQHADADDSISATILYGVEGCFTSGNDLSGFRNGPAANRIYPHNIYIDALRHARKPVIAVVDGICLGIGTIMLFHCDFVYVSPQTRFSLPFVNLGLSPEGGTSYILPHLIGYQKAAEIILLGEPFGAELAERIGLVNEIVASDGLMGRALDVVEKLASKNLQAVLAAKALLKRGMDDAVTTALARELDLFNERMETPEVRETINSFFNKKRI
ncbi:Enoyl-CoA hydratase/carnithine racemase [Desulfuromusa kysingii]|uniref:Enoyl-CoA hydratase/carnithine racemase n=1 Tax=Desulfuromusa kysingii TaxID=37625 RepID=A0A1H4D4Y9_9BACT|nr:enoyl-CoA hydratase-related protein [Desulfuromusa kysingii]SEA67697.1 Enoyl-CoA hydratase/carnithine racemase [Desulfuromusa kysingii]